MKIVTTTDQIVNESIDELISDYGVNPITAKRRGELAVQLFEEVSGFYPFENKVSLVDFVNRGAQLYYLENILMMMPAVNILSIC